MLDFSKAFDVVSHPKLIEKLDALGIHSSTSGWISSWLHRRQLRVTVNGTRSETRAVTSGVPQGSVLGPLLFLIFINDMPSHASSSTIKLFADDSVLYHPIINPGDERKLQEDLDSLVRWSVNSQMNFNVDKCNHIRISRRPNTTSSNIYSMSNKCVTTVKVVNYLGITIEDTLTFDKHITDICGRANRSLFMLMRNLKRARPKTRQLAYNTICRPKLEYASHTWSPHLQKHITLLESINRKAFRWCYGRKKYDSITELMKQKDWPTLESRRVKNDQNMYIRILLGEATVDRDKVLPVQSHSLNTRKGAILGTINTDVKNYFQNRLN